MAVANSMTVAQLSGIFTGTATTHLPGHPVALAPSTTSTLYEYVDATGTMHVLGNTERNFDPIFLRFGDGALHLADRPVQRSQAVDTDFAYALVDTAAGVYLDVGPSYGHGSLTTSIGPLRLVGRNEAAQLLADSHVHDEYARMILSPEGQAMVLSGLLASFPSTFTHDPESSQGIIDRHLAIDGSEREKRAIVEYLIRRTEAGHVSGAGRRGSYDTFEHDVPLSEFRFYLQRILDGNIEFKIEHYKNRPYLFFITISIEKKFPGYTSHWDITFTANLVTAEERRQMEIDESNRMTNTILAYARHIQENAGEGPVHVNPTWTVFRGFEEVSIDVPGTNRPAYGLDIMHNPQTGHWEINCRDNKVAEISQVLTENGIPFEVRAEYYDL